jgi:hypothetical protein
MQQQQQQQQQQLQAIQQQQQQQQQAVQQQQQQAAQLHHQGTGMSSAAGASGTGSWGLPVAAPWQVGGVSDVSPGAGPSTTLVSNPPLLLPAQPTGPLLLLQQTPQPLAGLVSTGNGAELDALSASMRGLGLQQPVLQQPVGVMQQQQQQGLTDVAAGAQGLLVGGVSTAGQLMASLPSSSSNAGLGTATMPLACTPAFSSTNVPVVSSSSPLQPLQEQQQAQQQQQQQQQGMMPPSSTWQ